jgi:hypothetical protein
MTGLLRVFTSRFPGADIATSATVTGGIPGPQFITDTFTASSATETIGRSGGVLQVSGVVVEAIPEPRSYALMGLGILSLFAFGRFRKLTA